MPSGVQCGDVKHSQLRAPLLVPSVLSTAGRGQVCALARLGVLSGVRDGGQVWIGAWA